MLPAVRAAVPTARSERGAPRLTGQALRIALTGPRQSGKTATMLRLATVLAGRGVQVAGVAQPARRAEGRIVGYDLLDLADGERVTLAELLPAAERMSGPAFRFAEEGWSWARQRILAARRDALVVGVDELGWVEADHGEGHLPPLLLPLTEERASCYLLGVRADRAEALGRRLGGFARLLSMPLAAVAEEELLQLVEERCRGILAGAGPCALERALDGVVR
ncbi:MAG: hypothetical protein FJ125_09150 [Deltaproteobacteria bacterium]|nr:hypothetical protein [Deltaproteobacteria bacterium]